VKEMIRRYLRQKFGSLSTVLALLLLALIACLPLNARQGFGSLDTLAVLVLAGGCVSRDASSGALQMILSRPIRRTGYLAGRYLGILAALLAFLAGAILLAAALDAVIGRLTVGPASREFSFPAAGLAAGHAFLAGALLAAAILFFSSFLRGWGDVLAVILFSILFGSMENLGRLTKMPLLSRVGTLAKENLAPSVPWETVLRGQNVFGEATGRYVFALALYWTLAAVAFSRREFTYGQD
jgi:hypothetical protein